MMTIKVKGRFMDKLEAYVNRYNELNAELMRTDLDRKGYEKVAKEQASLSEYVELYNRREALNKEISEAKEILRDEQDADMRDFLNAELEKSKEQLVELEKEIEIALIDKDEDDEKNVILEIRGGAGGDEASLFAGELLRMYQKFAEKHRFKFTIVSTSETGVGGLKEGVCTIAGKGCYSKFKFESGVHRVQRVPETESGGRVHTSTVTVAVLPENEDVEVNIEEKDLRIDVCRSSGAGGQSVNTTDSAVRIVHIPTGMIVTCQDERSQIQNREKAFRILKSKLYDLYKSQADAEYAEKRKCQVGTGDRSERIRTYNFPQARVTDHRINLTLYNLNAVMEGELDEIVDALTKAAIEEQLHGSK